MIGQRRFRPRFWPSVVTLAMLAALLGLGTWQLQRLAWKEALIAEMQARTAAAPMPLPRDLGDPALAYRRVVLRGAFLHEGELYLGARTHKGKAGFHVVTPLRLEDGRTVLVDRGWVPPERKAPASRAEGQAPGMLSLEGVIRRGGWGGMEAFRPENQPGDKLWLWLDLPAMAARAGLSDAVTAVYVAAGPAANPGGYPIGGQTRVDLANNHLQYAITWYTLAAALIVIYLLHQSRPTESPDGNPRP